MSEEGFSLDLSEWEIATEEITRAVERNLEEAMNDAVDDLVRISSNIAPIKTGVLRTSWTKEVTGILDQIKGIVEYSATEESLRYGRFNYALWTHEYMSSLGPRSQNSQGTDGYAVGNKYLSRPLNGEAAKYIQWFGEAVARGINRA